MPTRPSTSSGNRLDKHISVSISKKTAAALHVVAERYNWERLQYIRWCLQTYLEDGFIYKKLRDEKGKPREGKYPMSFHTDHRANLCLNITERMSKALDKKAAELGITRNYLIRTILVQRLNGELLSKKPKAKKAA